ncbi:MAG: BTAD domain-containing putative transcriptional regulator, partial [Balneolaceae bacterium]
MYRLFTFDGFTIEKDGKRLDQPGVHRKALAVLIAIAVEGTASREKLMALFWPDSDTDRAKGSLNQALHLLRHRFTTPDLIIGTTELRLNPARITSDVAQFKSALALKDFSTAVQLYFGPFLNGVQSEDLSDFEHWVENHRLDLEKRYMGALEKLALAAEADNDFVLAADWWRKLQNTDPYNSRVAVQLMMALGYSGDRAAA